MKSWFPFTDYDFYAYLASGSLLIAALDITGNGGQLVAQKNWPVAQVILLVAAAYVAGHLIASLSSWLLERLLARRLLAPPTAILLGMKKATLFQRAFAAVFIAQYYEPLPPSIAKRIFANAEAALQTAPGSLEQEPDTIFQVAYVAARESEDARMRVDDFRNQYGFCRNIAMVALIAAIAFGVRAIQTGDAFFTTWALISLFVAGGMTARFLKFYSTFATEVLRALARERREPK